MNKQEPFGYFKAEPFGWTDCAETDEGAVALYEHPATQPVQEPVALLDVSAVHSDVDGMYHHEIISRERIPYGAELFLHPAPNHDAFDAYVAKRLRRVCKLVGIQYCVPEDDSTLHGAMFSVLGQIASAIERKYGTISAVIYRAQDAEQERDTLREQVRVLKELMDKHNIGYEYRTALSAVKEQS